MESRKTPNFAVEDPFEHVKIFVNWLPNWIDIYFLPAKFNFIFGLIFHHDYTY